MFGGGDAVVDFVVVVVFPMKMTFFDEEGVAAGDAAATHQYAFRAVGRDQHVGRNDKPDGDNKPDGDDKPDRGGARADIVASAGFRVGACASAASPPECEGVNPPFPCLSRRRRV